MLAEQLSEEAINAVLNFQEPLRTWADQVEERNPDGIGRFLAIEIRTRLDAALAEVGIVS